VRANSVLSRPCRVENFTKMLNQGGFWQDPEPALNAETDPYVLAGDGVISQRTGDGAPVLAAESECEARLPALEPGGLHESPVI
jgi:hypothetical protein